MPTRSRTRDRAFTDIYVTYAAYLNKHNSPYKRAKERGRQRLTGSWGMEGMRATRQTGNMGLVRNSTRQIFHPGEVLRAKHARDIEAGLASSTMSDGIEVGIRGDRSRMTRRN